MNRVRVIWAGAVAGGAALTTAIVITIGGGAGSDTTAPSVALTAPAAGTVSAATTVSADASDNVAVVGVQFKLDGANLEAEDTTAPYSISWDTTDTTNGSHDLTAVARDAAGNSTTSATVTVTVSNGGAPTANLWVDTNGGTCTRSGSLVAYSDAAACASLSAAYAAASDANTGDTIRADAGNYPAQTLTFDSGKEDDTNRTNFILDGMTIQDSFIVTGAQHVYMSGLTLDPSGVTGDTRRLRFTPSTGNDVTLTSKFTRDWLIEDVNINSFLFRNVIDITLQDSIIGGWNQSTDAFGVPKIGAYPPDPGVPAQPSQNVILQRNSFQDIIRTTTGSAHAECLFLNGSQEDTQILNNVFTNCAVYDIFEEGGGDGYIIKGNVFDCARDTVGAVGGGTEAVKLKDSISNSTISFNSFCGDLQFDPSPTTYPTLVVTANAFVSGGCTNIPSSDITTGKNMRSGGSCGTGSVDADPGFTSVSTATCDLTACTRNNFHLAAAANAINAATGISGVPSTDYDGDSRPLGGTADVGADEKE